MTDGYGKLRYQSPPHPTGFTPDLHHVRILVRSSADGRAWKATGRARARNSRISPYEPKPLTDDPFEHWLWAVEDACFAAGREYEDMMRMSHRPHWRLWEFSQRMAWRFAPNSRLRQLLEPDGGEDEADYRYKWVNRWPHWPQWDFGLRLLWFYARDSRLRHLLAPDKPAEP